jgi:hypothetical protein
MKQILFGVFLALFFAALPAKAQTVLYCYNSSSGFSTQQPCPGNKNTTNHSVTITTGGTFQVVLSANANRASLTIENNNTSDNCWVYIGAGSATEGTAILLLSGGSYPRYFPYVPADEIQATCASNSDTLYVDTQ